MAFMGSKASSLVPVGLLFSAVGSCGFFTVGSCGGNGLVLVIESCGENGISEGQYQHAVCVAKEVCDQA